MWEKIGFCIVCFVGMVVFCFVGMVIGEVLANRIDKWFKSRSNLKNEMKTKNELEFDLKNQIQTQNVNEDINNLKNKIDGR